MIDRTQDHAKQIESAAIALKNDNLHGLEAAVKEKTELLEEITKKFRDLEVKFLQVEEELKSKLNQGNKEAAIKE
jgi:predicted transcriptional regulator